MTHKELLTVANPILFNTDMVRAIQDGRKTTTRRVIKLKYGNTHIEWHKDKYGRVLVEMQNDVEGETYGVRPDGTHWQKVLAMIEIKPKYKVGNILYVRETWQQNYDGSYSYRAGHKFEKEGGWNPSIHMPKEAARIFLKVKNVRAERLQDIDGYGIFLEGVDNGKSNPTMGNRWENMQKMVFSELWNSTIKKSDLDKYGWAANPWVWVIEFERVEVIEQ